MIYLASPYTHPVSFVRFERYVEAMKATRWLMAHHYSVISPIVHCHLIAHEFDLPKDAEFWKHYNHGLLRRAENLYILGIDGWGASAGIKDEIAFAAHHKIPMFRMQPDNDEYIIFPH